MTTAGTSDTVLRHYDKNHAPHRSLFLLGQPHDSKETLAQGIRNSTVLAGSRQAVYFGKRSPMVSRTTVQAAGDPRAQLLHLVVLIHEGHRSAQARRQLPWRLLPRLHRSASVEELLDPEHGHKLLLRFGDKLMWSRHGSTAVPNGCKDVTQGISKFAICHQPRHLENLQVSIVF